MGKGFALVLAAVLIAGCRTGPEPVRPIPADFVPFASYGSGETALYGYVLDTLHAPVGTAQVSVGARYRAYSDSTGRYALRVPSWTRHRVRIVRVGFMDDSVSVEVDGEPRRIDFVLRHLCARETKECVVLLPDGRHVLEACHCG